MLIECIPNVSEGRDARVIAALSDAIENVRDVHLLDRSSDQAHHRAVFTFVGGPSALKQAVLALVEVAVARIDLRRHRGQHPRVGAVDVVPFVPLEGATTADCVALARDTGKDVAGRFDVPVYLYEAAAADPARRRLEDIRRGQFEGLAAKMARAGWTPDFGPATPHPTAGATVVGARLPLIAFNVNLATDRIDIARSVAAAVRESSGGLRCVKAIGVRLESRGIVQVSMNLTNFEATPIFRASDAVRTEAARRGVGVVDTEIVGLAPAAALVGITGPDLRLAGSLADRVLETQLKRVMDGLRK
jgi:glutamate formiminotransferase / 5-formyltetrahydrofolate cyclo-ligase